jgi:hypothetical protein
MAADKIRGKDLVVYIDGIPIGCSKTADLTITSKTTDTTSKCDTAPNGEIWNSAVPTSIGWTISDSGFVVIDNTSQGGVNEYSAVRLIDAQTSAQKVYVTFSSFDGKIFYGGDAWITTNKITAPVEDIATYDVTITGNGPLSKTPVS